MKRDDICLYLAANEYARLQALLAGRNTARKLVWRAGIVLAAAYGCGLSAIMRRANPSKPTLWRWQARYLDEGIPLCQGSCPLLYFSSIYQVGGIGRWFVIFTGT